MGSADTPGWEERRPDDDPGPWEMQQDGEVFEGPAVSVAYPATTTLSPAQQERVLEQLAARLRAAHLPAGLMRVGEEIDVPFIEIACDIEHHRRIMAA